MAVVIRLQGLPVEAGSADIRHFFSGLKIPDGGVHIIGGKLGEAFIIFVTDEDARRAMSRAGGMIKKSYIQLFLSSKTEMQGTLDMNRKGSRDSKHLPPSVESLSKILTAMKKGMHQNKFQNDHLDSDFHSSGSNPADNLSGTKRDSSGAKKDTREPNEDGSIYVFLYGLPYTSTEDDVRYFFKGLHITEINFLLRSNGLKNGNALLKFGSVNDANASLKRNNAYLGQRFVSVKKSTEEKWVEAGGQIGYIEAYPSSTGNSYKGAKKLSRSRSPKMQRPRSRSPNQDFYVHLSNLSADVRKQEVKKFLGDPGMEDSMLKLLPDQFNARKMECFVRLESKRSHDKCLSLNKSRLRGWPVFIAPISRTAMLDLIDAYEKKFPPQRDDPQEKNYSRKSLEDYSDVKRSLYVRNFPFDVTKNEVKKFFVGFSVLEDDIILLYDNKSVGLGEALVRFPNEQRAILAESLNRQRFLGTEVLLRRISDDQVKELGGFYDPPKKHSPDYRDQYTEPVNSRESTARPFEFAEDFGNRSYEPSNNSFGNGGFGSSREQLSSQYNTDFHGAVESYRRMDMEKSNLMDYSDPGPIQGIDSSRSNRGLIRMKNIPFTATTEEILDFFYGYNVIPESVFLRVTKQGMPSGMATVCIKNYDEAAAAVNELDGRPIGPRKISLTLLKN